MFLLQSELTSPVLCAHTSPVPCGIVLCLLLICWAFILPEANNKSTVHTKHYAGSEALQCTASAETLLDPSHSFSMLHNTYFAFLGLRILLESFLTMSCMEIGCQDSKLALSIPLQLMETCICTTFKGQQPFSFTTCTVPLECCDLSKYQHTHYSLTRTKAPHTSLTQKGQKHILYYLSLLLRFWCCL